MKKFNLNIQQIISIFIEIFFLIIGSVFLSSVPYSIKSAELTVYQNDNNRKKVDSVFATVRLSDGNEPSIHEKIFNGTYADNFSYQVSSTRLLTVSDDDGIAKFNISFNGMELPNETSVVSGLNYSNSEELVRFETVCINLLKFRPRQEEHNYDRDTHDGFVYIPDYYADYIIENFMPLNSTYLDLIENPNNTISIGKDGNYFKYRIANIFRVKDFNKEYAPNIDIKYNDFQTGLKLDNFLNGFCFVLNYDKYNNIDNSFKTALVYEMNPKKYILDEIFTEINQYKIYYKSDVQTTFYQFYGGVVEKYSNSESLVNAYFNNSSNGIWQILFSAILNLLSIALLIIIYIKFKSSNNDLHFYVISLSIPIIYLLIAFLTRRLVSVNASVMRFFNPYVSLGSVFIFVTSIILTILKINRRGNKNEEKQTS